MIYEIARLDDSPVAVDGPRCTGVYAIPEVESVPAANPDNGALIYVQDGVLKWRSPSGTVYVLNAVAVEGGAASYTGAAAGSDILTSKVTGDAQNRFVLNADGRLEWGGGGTGLDTNLFREFDATLHTGATFVTEGDLRVDVAGKGLKVKEGANAKMGTLTLDGATPVVVATTAVTANSRIFLTHNTPGGTPGFAWVSDRTAATSFSVTGTAGDTSVLAWLIVEPA